MNEVVESLEGNWLRKQRLKSIKTITNMRVIISGTITYGLKDELYGSVTISMLFVK